jgi:hypothetical protein
MIYNINGDRMREINKSLKNNIQEKDLNFKLWKDELNKELNSFWKLLENCSDD